MSYLIKLVALMKWAQFVDFIKMRLHWNWLGWRLCVISRDWSHVHNITICFTNEILIIVHNISNFRILKNLDLFFLSIIKFFDLSNFITDFFTHILEKNFNHFSMEAFTNFLLNLIYFFQIFLLLIDLKIVLLIFV